MLKKKIIHFDYYYKTSIEKGIKKATTRLKNYNLELGDIVECNYTQHDCPKFYVKITSIIKIKFKNLNNDNALSEGYLDVGLLKSVLKTYYPNITNEDFVYQYTFQYLGV